MSAAADQAMASYADDGRERSLDELDAARDRLARQLAEADPAQPPTAQMEQFIPWSWPRCLPPPSGRCGCARTG